MSDWVGAGTAIVPGPSVAPPCLEYLTVAEARGMYGADVAELTDAQILRRLVVLARRRPSHDALLNGLEWTATHSITLRVR